MLFLDVQMKINTQKHYFLPGATRRPAVPCAISSYEGAEVTLRGNISTYFEPSDDNRPFYPIVIYSRATQRALSLLKVCTHWATNRLPATLLVGRCVSRSGSGSCRQWSDGCCVILRPCDLQVCLGSLSQPGQQAVLTSAKFVLPG